MKKVKPCFNLNRSIMQMLIKTHDCESFTDFIVKTTLKMLSWENVIAYLKKTYAYSKFNARNAL